MHFISKLAEVSTGSKTWFHGALRGYHSAEIAPSLDHFDTRVTRLAGLIADLLCSAFTKPGALARASLQIVPRGLTASPFRLAEARSSSAINRRMYFGVSLSKCLASVSEAGAM